MPAHALRHHEDRRSQAQDAGACRGGGRAAKQPPDIATLAELNAIMAAAEPYVTGGTRAVLGEGPLKPALAFVGEQPGDQEDLQGRPFVGPAGQLLTRAMEEAGIRRTSCYLTNAVKHFKFTLRGKRRIHAKPNAHKLTAYRPWLEAEVQLIQPRAIICLGATAAQALMGASFRVTHQRGKVHRHEWTDWLLATLHPSALLRMPDPARKAQALEEFRQDMQKVAEHLHEIGAQ